MIKIMIVDDAEMPIQFAMDILSGFDFEFIVAKSGQEALKKLEHDKPDLILLDYEMPGMNGLDLLKLLRTSESTKSIPVIMVSSSKDVDLMEKAFIDGCSEYTVKPLHKIDVLMKIQSLTGVELV